MAGVNALNKVWISKMASVADRLHVKFVHGVNRPYTHDNIWEGRPRPEANPVCCANLGSSLVLSSVSLHTCMMAAGMVNM